ncbi:MAG: alpha/beta hydrolase [Proteobacteria bacterium]|nr:alpha/beta hydrolase [Pseudomonadota bacterium]
MTSRPLPPPPGARGAALAFAALVVVAATGAILASAIQRSFGDVEVTDTALRDDLGRTVAAKLFRPNGASASDRRPGILFVHGYESCRETGDPIAIELARRGAVTLSIDTLGRGNSDDPGMDEEAPGFDTTYGARAALDHLSSLPFVDRDAIALVGHSLGAGISYEIALSDPRVQAIALLGYGFDTRATPSSPRNMLMVIGAWDEFRDRMTGTRDIAAEWMGTEAARGAFAAPHPAIGETYGDFEDGTARRVAVPNVIHIGEPHSEVVVAEVLGWMARALPGVPRDAAATDDQIWPWKEWATLVSMLACLWSLLPLGLLLLAAPPFAPLRGVPTTPDPIARGGLMRHAIVNGLVMWLYLPCALTVFAIHKYVVPVDGAFPMMVVNVTIFWFFVTNAIGILLYRRWARRRPVPDAATPISGSLLARATALALVLFGFAYAWESAFEAALVVDFRFVFAFANDLTPHRAALSLRYLPFILAGFFGLGLFLHARLGLAQRSTWLGTFAATSARNLVVVTAPLVLLLAVQYVPLLTTGAIPLVGPGGMFVLFTFNLFHVVGVLVAVVPLSTGLHMATGRITAGAVLCALLVAWMFASTQVIAPIPID